MTKVQPITKESVKSEREVLPQQHFGQIPIDHILQRLSIIELPAKEHFERQVAPEPQTQDPRQFLYVSHALPGFLWKVRQERNREN